MKKIKSNINDIIYISRITQVTKKRLRIFFSVLLSNITVLLDIGIIVFFANILTGQVTENQFILFFLHFFLE